MTRFLTLRPVQYTISLIKRKMSTSQAAGEVLFEQVNHIGVITLNRPKQLNALNLSMIRKITPQLRTWETDPSIDMVLIRGTGEQAFCAGGDIKAIRDNALKGDKKAAMSFFGEEYQLNYLISKFKKPYIALINGITMGGGVGLSVHGSFRIATEKTMFAMPETAIGFFPDVGGMHVLSKLGTLGLYLALTGHRLKGQDVFTSGIATHYLQSSQLSEFEKNLFGTDGGSLENLQNMLGQFKLETNTTLSRDNIEEAFSAESVEQIFDNLHKMNTDWSRKQIQLLNKMSPTSLKVTFKQFHACNGKSLKEVLLLDYRLCQRFIQENDFQEGVRALLIDKDNKPQWKPNNLNNINDNKIDWYFKELPDDLKFDL